MTRLLMAASAVLMAVAGVAGSFLPHELLRALGIPPSGVLPVMVQLTAALYLGFAMLNWTARDSLIGGIYNRPVAIGNLLHFVSGALALLKYATSTRPPVPVIAMTVVYTAFAIAFGLVLFTSPVKRQT
ncbi:MAG TPA: hypothetical protein VEO54_01860 [Thermoanaerobaculia bacterium]|nr:hypothetical protein [Thermoanaerobaculia bacterium]